MRVENSFTEWGVRLGDSDRILQKGRGFDGQLYAQEEVFRITHNASLPNVGQPKFGTLVKREVVEIRETTSWEVVE